MLEIKRQAEENEGRKKTLNKPWVKEKKSTENGEIREMKKNEQTL